MEIRNIKLLVQDTGKFRIPDEGGQGRDSPKSMWGLVNSSLHCAGQGEVPEPTLEPQCARAQSSHSPWEPFIPPHICRQRSQSLPQLNKQFKNYLLGP